MNSAPCEICGHPTWGSGYCKDKTACQRRKTWDGLLTEVQKGMAQERAARRTETAIHAATEVERVIRAMDLYVEGLA